MSGWVPAAPAMDPSIRIPEGLAVAGMGRRVGAWILDAIFSALLGGAVFLIGIIATGAVSVNRQAIDQYREYASNPFADVTAPMLDVNASTLAVVAVAYVIALALYLVWPWMAWGASPAQKMLGLRVVDASTGANLGIDQALLRWLVLTGVTTMIGAVGIVTALDWVARTPTNEWMQTGGTSSQADFGFGGAYTLLSYGSTLWPILLLIVTAIDRMKRGWHDKIAGSIVLGPIRYGAYAAYPGYGGVPAWPPQAPGTAPAWPPQAPGTAPVWPPQPAGTPPQAPGYPPSAYPGYQGYPGYPPQGQPPAAPPAPPAPPEPPAPPDPPADSSPGKPKKKG